MFSKKCFLKDLNSFLTNCKYRACLSKIHALMITSGLFIHGTLNAQLISSYRRTGDIHLARKLFDVLPKRGIHSWNAMIVSYLREDNPVEVLSVYEQMGLEEVKPDSSTFTVATKACAALLNLEMGERIWQHAVECGFGNDIFVGSSVLNLYAKCGEMDKARGVFEKMQKRDVVSWGTMILGYVKSGRAVEALVMYRRMQIEGLEADGVVMLGLMQACANSGDVKMGSSVHGYLIRRGFSVGIVEHTSLVDMYAKNGALEYASHVFRLMQHRNVVSWSAFISGCAQNGLAENALELLIEMQSLGYAPDKVSLVGALFACSQVGLSILGRSIHGYIVRRLDLDHVLGTALIDMHAKCGSISYARALYDQISSKDVICWNTMIASYGTHGQGKEALLLFHQMIEMKLTPDDATFASLLSALSHSGLVEEGQHWFNLMVNEYKIEPSEKHYACLVDLLARAGKVEEAMNLIDSMTSEPRLSVWVALLSGCHNHKKFLIGELAAKNVLELSQDEPGVQALVSNFYAAARKWDEVAGVRKLMKQTRISKVPGYSVVEVNGLLNAFLVEDKSHPQYEEMLRILEELEKEMVTIDYAQNIEFMLQEIEV